MEARVNEVELYRGLLDALGKVPLVEGEPKLPVLEDIIGSGLVISSAGGVLHDFAVPVALPSARSCCPGAEAWACRWRHLNVGLHLAGSSRL